MQNVPTDEAREMVMQAQKLYDEFAQKLRQEGRQEGVLKGLRDAITEVCAARGLKLADAHRAKLHAEPDADVLRRWLTRAATVTRAADVFADAR